MLVSDVNVNWAVRVLCGKTTLPRHTPHVPPA